LYLIFAWLSIAHDFTLGSKTEEMFWRVDYRIGDTYYSCLGKTLEYALASLWLILNNK